MKDRIIVLGVVVADTAYRATRLPMLGETVLGNDVRLGPGGKGSNQSVAAAMAESTEIDALMCCDSVPAND